MAGKSGHDAAPRDRKHPPHVDEAQQPMHRQGHAG
ncbi:hypothetical protein J2802_003731 [Paraburkholderia caribensis]|nr:hypothetical protein [Paraburkholderia caribensis]